MSIASLYPSINPSLLLDFANVKRLDPRITFTRTTTATYYDGVTTAKAGENLFTYSEQIDNADWAKSSATVTANSTTAPDGTTTADTLTEAAATGVPYFKETITTTADTITISVYAKANGRNQVCLSLYGGAANKYISAVYDLSGVSVSKTQAGSSGTISSTSITSVGNSWYRLVMTGSVTAPSTIQPYFYLTNSTTPTIDSFGTPAAYAGNGTSGMYFWGAQAEIRSSVTAYTATTTQAITNYIPVLQTAAAGQARFDHNPTTGESLGLLIEEARTNLVTYSADFGQTSEWTPLNATITTNQTISPAGDATADQYTPTNSAAANRVMSNADTVATATQSIYVKANGYTKVALREENTTGAYAAFDLSTSTGSILDSSGTVTQSITPVGNSWFRISMTVTTTDQRLGIRVLSPSYTTGSVTATWTANGFSGIFIWGAQLEAGSFATSYIPTVASTATRNADAASMTGTNFSSWFNNGEGTLFVNFKTSVATGYPQAAYISDGTSNNTINIDAQSGLRSIVTTLGVGVASFSASKSGSGDLVTLAYKVNDFGSSFNGAAASTDTSGNLPVVSQFGIGQSYSSSNLLNGTIKKISYYPIKATSTQLQALTV